MFVKNVFQDLIYQMDHVVFVVILVKHVIVMEHVQLVKVHSQQIQTVIVNALHVQFLTVKHVVQQILLNVKLVQIHIHSTHKLKHAL